MRRPGGAGYRHCVTADRQAAGAGVPGWHRWLAGAAASRWLGAVVLAGVIAFTLTIEPGGVQRGPAQLVPLLACVLVVVLRRWPLPVLGVVTAAVWLFTALGAASLSFGVLLGVAMYFSVLSLPRPRSIALAGGVAAVLGATVVYSALMVRNAQVAAEVTVIFVPLAGAWFIADSVAARRRYQAGLAAQAEREQAAEVREERVRIAREMHDVVAHALAVITVQAGVGRCLADQRPEAASAALGSIEAISRTAQDELRVVLGLLRDGADGTAPLAPAPRLTDVTDLADTVRAAGLCLELRMAGTDRRLSPALELSVYRVMQEALTNVVKHAPGARAVAELTVGAGTVRLDVRDDGGPGGGPAPPSAEPGGGLGITGMRERIGAFGGWLVAGPAAAGGFQVTAEVPIEGAVS
jgi:signal transduction histidine kinase